MGQGDIGIDKGRGRGEARQRDAARTQARILAAAYNAFAEQGFAKAGTRDIARRAEVTLSLISRYFGTKAALFERVLVDGLSRQQLLLREREGFGANMVARLANEADRKLIAMMVLSLSDPEARHVVRRVTRKQVIVPFAEWLGPPDGQVRALNILTLLNGYTLQLLHMEGERLPDETADWVAGELQRLVDRAA